MIKNHKDTYLDSDNELVKHILLGVLFYFAQQELTKISQNTKNCLEKAQRRGEMLGRLPLPEVRNKEIRDKEKELGSANVASREAGVLCSTVK